MISRAYSCKLGAAVRRAFSQLVEKEAFDNFVVFEVGSQRLAITRMALEEAKKNNIDISGLVGRGSGEAGRVSYWDVHRLAHPSKFHSRDVIELHRHSLSEESLDAVFEKTWGKQNSQTGAASEKPQAKAQSPTAVQPPETKTVPARGGVRKAGEPARFTDIPTSQVRRVIAQRLQESTFNTPHYYLTVKLRVDRLLKFREELNALLPEKITLNDLFIKAVAMTSRGIPESRSFWDEPNGRVRVSDAIGISFAVDTGSGLITPIVQNADRLRVSQIQQTTKQLIDKAKKNKLAPTEYIGGTMSISNMGMLGVQQFTAIINPPQSCILAIASPFKELALQKTPDGHSEQAGFHTYLNVTLSCDHRVMDGAVGSQYLQRLKTYIENPLQLVI